MNEIAGRNWRVIVGDVIDGLRTLPDNSVQCCVTSPPYWGLRDYGVDGQIGLEPTPKDFTDKMVEVFEEVRRVLRPDGTCWVNIGDSYARAVEKGGSGPNGKHDFIPDYGNARKLMASSKVGSSDGVVGRADRPGTRATAGGLKPKDLVGIPWRLAFALQDAGWWLRSEIIWHKRSPMPESVTDRPTKSHEQIFLLTKSESYFFDQEAVKEPATGNAHHRGDGVNPKAKTPGKNSRIHVARTGASPQSRQNESFSAAVAGLVESRNIRTVWTISSESFKGAHFATFPTEIPRRAISAGTSEKGCCPTCGTPWRRIIEKDRVATRPGIDSKINRASDDPDSPYERQSGMIVGNRDPKRHMTTTNTVGWEPGCECGCAETVPCVVLDPFSGSGTSGMVATEMGRIYIGCELNPEYAEMSRKRIDSWKTRDAVKAVVSTTGQRPLF